jgi:hypothetical protein
MVLSPAFLQLGADRPAIAALRQNAMSSSQAALVRSGKENPLGSAPDI